MRFSLTEEQVMLRASVRGALARDLPLPRVRACLETGDMSAASELATAQGWTGVGIAEDAGGQGGGVVEQAILAEELGYAAAPSSALLGGALAARVLSGGGDGAQALLEPLADGTRRVVLAIDAGAGDVPYAHITADHAHGVISNVLGAPGAEIGLVVDGAGAYAVPLAAEGCVIRPRSLVDPGRSIALITFAGTPATPLGAAGDLADAAALGAVLIAAEAVGAAERLLEMTVEYVAQRVQFGVVIGTFQAVKHTAADMLVDVETARSAVHYAAWAFGAGRPDAIAAVNMAKSYAVPAAAAVADRALALHGAVGFTWEHDLHLFLKRIHSAAALFGGCARHREQLASSLDLTGASRAPVAEVASSAT
jgi:alkylation response protein AidB-like acyl-CoA dehydrogenase